MIIRKQPPRKVLQHWAQVSCYKTFFSVIGQQAQKTVMSSSGQFLIIITHTSFKMLSNAILMEQYLSFQFAIASSTNKQLLSSRLFKYHFRATLPPIPHIVDLQLLQSDLKCPRMRKTVVTIGLTEMFTFVTLFILIIILRSGQLSVRMF